LYQHTMYVISLSNIYSVSSWDRHDTKSCTNTLCMLLVYLTFMVLVHETDMIQSLVPTHYVCN
jgi:hypothetical protein